MSILLLSWTRISIPRWACLWAEWKMQCWTLRNRAVSGLAIREVNRDIFDQRGGKGIIIPYRWVVAVADIIIIRHLTRNAKNQREIG